MEIQSLLSLEHRLSQDPEMAEDFYNQIDDMENRGASAVLSKEVLESWNGRLLLLATGVKGKNKLLRVSFEKARRGYPSMNECLHKGTKCFFNNLVMGYVVDISKFYNKVCLGKRTYT